MDSSLGGTGLGHTSVSCVGWCTDLVECVLVPVAVGRGAPWPTSSSLRGPFPKALNNLWGTSFIAWHLFLGECWRGPRHFWSHWACLGYSLAPRPILKKALCHTRPVGGVYNKYWLLPNSQTWQFRWTLLPAVLILLFCIYVLFIQYTCSIYFLFFLIFCLAPNRPQRKDITFNFLFLDLIS